MAKVNIVLIGAGSAVFGTRLIRDLAQTKDLTHSHLTLVDIDQERLKLVYEVGLRLIQESGSQLILSMSGEYEEALKDADFVICTVAQGGVKAWLSDVELPRKHGYHYAVADTMGPGGMARAFRTIPIILQIAKDMERLCPNAWLINYSNPMTAICRAITKYTSIKAIGLCHGLLNTVRRIAPRIGKDPETVTAWGAGINHFLWLTDLFDVNGTDLYPILRRHVQDNNEQPVAYDLMSLYGLFPSGGDDHIIEFVPYYTSEDRGSKYNIEMNYVRNVVERQHKEYDNLHRLLKDPNSKITPEMDGNSESAAEIIDCIANAKTGMFMVNIANQGNMPGLPLEAIVEVPGVVTPSGVHGLHVNPLPTGITGRILTCLNEYELVVEAAYHRSRNLAIQAMLVNPASVSREKAEAVVDALLEVNQPYIGTFD